MSAASSRKSTGDGFMADAELALDDTSDFTIGSFIQTVYDQVPATITREQALGTLMALQETYDNPDIAKRLALLAEDCEIEDPAGPPRGEIGRASCRKECVITCRSRWSTDN